MRTRLAALAMLCIAVLITALPTPAVSALSVPAGVPVSGFADLVVDAGHDRVFVTQADDQLLVASLDLATSQEVTLPAAGRAMTLSEDRATLYVLLDGPQIAAIDTATLAVSTVDAELSSCPDTMVATHGLLWVGSSCSDGAGVDAIDPLSGTVTHVDGRASKFVLAAGPDLLVTATEGQVRSFEIGDPPSSVLTLKAEAAVAGTIKDLAASPDGTRLYRISQNAWDEYDGLQISTLPDLQNLTAPDAIWDINGAALAVRPDGLVALANNGGVEFTNREGIAVYDSQYLADGWHPLPRSLAFADDSVFGVWSLRGHPSMRVLGAVRPGWHSEIKWRAYEGDRFVDYGQTITIKGTLSTHSTDQRDVKVYASNDSYDHLAYLGAATADASGSFSIDVAPPRSSSILLVYDGDDNNAGSYLRQDGTTYVRSVVSSRMLKARHVRHGVFEYGVHDRAVIAVHVGPNQSGKCAGFILDVRVGSRWRHVNTKSCLRLDARSNLRAYVAGGPEYEGLLWRIKAVAKGNQIAEFAVGPTHQFRFVH